MPCSDVTEILRVTLDLQDRVTHYSLSKLSCGASVGKPSLLRKWIDHRHISEIMAASPADVLAVMPTRSTTWEFITIKHLLAVKAGLSALTGISSGLPGELCTIANVEHGPDGISMEADIRVDILTDEIKACGGCDNCGPI